MADLLLQLRMVSDPTRVRLLLLVQEQELSVAELQEILGMGQSRISTQLSQLKSAGLVSARRVGKRSLYAARQGRAGGGSIRKQLIGLLATASEEIPEVEADQQALAIVLHKRSDRARAYFNELAGKFGRTYCPGRSWKGLAEGLLKLLPPVVVADLGAGEGTFSQLLAQRAEQVIAVDNSEKMVEFGTEIARKNGFDNLEYRLGDIESPPIDDDSVDIVFLSQALHHAQRPNRAVREAFRITRPGGKILILDLLSHQFEEARELYADVWLGFSEAELHGFLKEAGFKAAEVALVDREEDPPHFQTMLAVAEKPVA